MTTPVTTQQLITQALVGAMTVNIMATVVGIMMASVGVSAFEVPPAELKGTQVMVRDLKLAFGENIVDQAVKNVGVESALALAREVERLVIEEMYEKYGRSATDSALGAAIPGDILSAREIAATLAVRGYGRTAPPSVVPAPVMQSAVQVAKKKIKQKAKPVLDTKTNIQYRSKAAAGMSVAAEYGLDPTNTFIWYEVIKKDPTRFKEIGALSPTGVISPATAYPPPKAHSPTTARGEQASGALSIAWTTEGKQAVADRVLPEWKQILRDMSSGDKLLKPRKFIEKLCIVLTPAGFNPSAQGDFAFTRSYAWDGGQLTKGPSYTYDTMISTIESPYERTVDVPKGVRVWICTYDGQWGGFWSRVNVYVHPDDLLEKPGLKLLHEGRMHGEA